MFSYIESAFGEFSKDDKTRAKEAGENISDVGYKISGGRIGSPRLNATQKNRSRYAMKRFIE